MRSLSKSRCLLSGLMAVAMVGLSMPARAATTVNTEEHGTVENEIRLDNGSLETETNVQQQEKASVVAKKFNVSQEAVLDMRVQQKLGWGEIAHVLAISEKSGTSIDTILALRKENMGWGEIAKKYNLTPREISQDIRNKLGHTKEFAERKGERMEERGEKLKQRGERVEEKGERMESRGERATGRSLERTGQKMENAGQRMERIGEKVERHGEKGS